MNRLKDHPALRSATSRWPVILGATLSIVFAFMFLRRGGETTAAAETAKSDSSSASDSVVRLDSAAQRLVTIELATVQSAGSAGLLLNGTITFDENRVSVIAPRAEGRVVDVKSDLGQQVSAGAVLALIESSDVGAGRGDVARGRAALEVAKGNYEREKRLFEQSVSSEKEMLDARAAYLTAVADYNSSVSKVKSLGAISGSGATYGLTSPISGIVVERNAMPGQIAGPTTNLFTVADLNRVWITVDAYESDANRIRSGASALVSARSLPGETFPARITYAGGVVDTATHTVKVRLEIPNPGRRLRPGMFAEVKLDLPVTSPAASNGGVTVPEDAVQDVNGNTIVFVPASVTGRFIARTVAVAGTSSNRTVTVTSGLRPGDRVVVKGAFQLKAELTKGSFGDDDG